MFFCNAKEPTLHHDALLTTHHQGWFCIALNFIYETVFYTLFKADLNFDMSPVSYFIFSASIVAQTKKKFQIAVIKQLNLETKHEKYEAKVVVGYISC